MERYNSTAEVQHKLTIEDFDIHQDNSLSWNKN